MVEVAVGGPQGAPPALKGLQTAPGAPGKGPRRGAESAERRDTPEINVPDNR